MPNKFMIPFLTLLFLVMGPGLGAHAHDYKRKPGYKTITLSSYSFNVRQGQTKSLRLPDRMFVQKLYIQAEAKGRYDSYAHVSANGDTKGTLYLPGRDPHYTVTIADVADSVEITSTKRTARIHKVKAVVKEYPSRRGSSVPLPGNSEVAQLADNVLDLVDELQGYTNYRDFGTYLLPIRKSAAKALARATAKGDASISARPYYEALVEAIKAAEAYFDEMYERKYAYRLAIDLVSEKERLKDMLD